MADDGSHWYRTWMMLRDWRARRGTQASRRHSDASSLPFYAGELHEWTCNAGWAAARLIDLLSFPARPEDQAASLMSARTRREHV
jgi:hypothetical protein